jgi:hypothetical protein
VAHACNPGYSGGRDQEDCNSKPAPSKYFERPYLGKTTKGKLISFLCNCLDARSSDVRDPISFSFVAAVLAA